MWRVACTDAVRVPVSVEIVGGDVDYPGDHHALVSRDDLRGGTSRS